MKSSNKIGPLARLLYISGDNPSILWKDFPPLFERIPKIYAATQSIDLFHVGQNQYWVGREIIGHLPPSPLYQTRIIPPHIPQKKIICVGEFNKIFEGISNFQKITRYTIHLSETVNNHYLSTIEQCQFDQKTLDIAFPCGNSLHLSNHST